MTIALPATAAGGRGSTGLAWFIVTLVLVTAAIWPALTIITGFWARDEYSHAWLIAPLAALLLMSRLPGVVPGRGSAAGVVIAVLAVLLLAAGWLTRNTTLSIYGAIAGLYGLTWATFGQPAMRRLSGPILFLLFMIPLPLAIYISLSQSMQLLSSRLGVELIRVLGIDVVRDGNVIELANGSLEVAEACNGLRYLFPLLSISYLLAVLLDDRLWKKLVLFLSAVPIAILMNGLRLALIGFLVDRFGIGMASGVQHEVEGALVFGLCVVLLLAETSLLLRLGTRGRFPAGAVLFPGRRAFAALAAWPGRPAFVAAACVLSAGAIVLLALPPRREVLPERRALTLFPMQIGPWRGLPQPLDAETLRALSLTDYTLADLVKPGETDRAVNLFAAYYATQRPGVQVHSPRLCIPGGGWTIVEQGHVTLAADDGGRIPANRVVIARNGARQVVYYWFEERGRHLVDETEIKIYALIDAALRNRSDGALVRLVAPVTDGDDAGADRDLQAVARSLLPMLQTYLPP